LTKIEKIEKSNNIQFMADKRVNNGGARKGAGRKPKPELEAVRLMKEEIKNFGVANDPIAKKQRIKMILEKLYSLGINEGNVPALKELLDRLIGKAKEHKEIEGDLSIVFEEIIVE